MKIPAVRQAKRRAAHPIARMRRRALHLAAVSAALSLAAAHSAPAASGTWSGAAADGLWQTPANWDNVPGSTAGAGGSSPDVATFSGNPASIAITNDPNRDVAGITFDSTTSAFTIGTTTGNTLYLTNGGTIAVTAAVAPPTGATAISSQSISAPIVLNGGSYTIRNDSTSTLAGILVGAGGLSGGAAVATTLTLDGVNAAGINNGTSFVNGPISEGAATSLSVIKNGTGTWELRPTAGANTYTGNTTVNAGVLRFLTGGASPNSLLIAHGGKLQFSTNGMTAKEVRIDDGGTFATSNATTTLSLTNSTGPALFMNFSGVSNTLSIASPFSLNGATANQGGIKLSPLATGQIDLGATTTILDIGAVLRPIDIARGGAAPANYDLRIRGPIIGGSATGGMLKQGDGILRVDNAALSFNGKIEIQNGDFRFNAPNQLTGNVSITVDLGGTLSVAHSAADTINLNVNSGPALTFDYAGGAGAPMTGPLAFAGTTANQGGLKLTAGAGTTAVDVGSTTNTLALGNVTRTFEIAKGALANSYDLRVRSNIIGGSATGGILKTGAGLLRIDNTANSFTGTLEIQAGSVNIANDNALTGVPALAITGGNLLINGGTGATQTFSALTMTKGSITAGSSLTSTLKAPTYTFNVAGPDTATVDVILADSGGASTLTKNGAGLAILTNAGNTFTGSTTVNNGTLQLDKSFRSSSAFTVADGARANVTANGNRVLEVKSINLNSTGILDLNDNDLVVDYGTNPSPFNAVRDLVFNGYSSSVDPSKTGIISSTGQTAGNTILAVIDNAFVGATEWPIGSGQTIDGNSIIGKYTYFGDMDLSGDVTADDYGILDANLGTTPPPGIAWVSGDADLSGDITPDDYGILDANFGSGVGSPLAPATSAVPEPTALTVLIGAAGLLSGRRRRADAKS